jgi:hypothetical protein
MTDDVHTAVADAASVAVQVSGVVPTPKLEPELGEQLVVTGAVPPLVVGSEKLTPTGPPLLELPVGIGHMIDNGVGDGVPGAVWPTTSVDGALVLPWESYAWTTK